MKKNPDFVKWRRFGLCQMEKKNPSFVSTCFFKRHGCGICAIQNGKMYKRLHTCIRFTCSIIIDRLSCI